MAKKYDEASVIASISKKAVVNRANKTITYNPNNHQIGNGTWGKIDYLTKYCGWTLLKDNSINKSDKASNVEIGNLKDKEIKVRKMK